MGAGLLILLPYNKYVHMYVYYSLRACIRTRDKRAFVANLYKQIWNSINQTAAVQRRRRVNVKRNRFITEYSYWIQLKNLWTQYLLVLYTRINLFLYAFGYQAVGNKFLSKSINYFKYGYYLLVASIISSEARKKL